MAIFHLLKVFMKLWSPWYIHLNFSELTLIALFWVFPGRKSFNTRLASWDYLSASGSSYSSMVNCCTMADLPGLVGCHRTISFSTLGLNTAPLEVQVRNSVWARLQTLESSWERVGVSGKKQRSRRKEGRVVVSDLCCASLLSKMKNWGWEKLSAWF